MSRSGPRRHLISAILLVLAAGHVSADEIDDLVAAVSQANIQAHVAALAAAPRDTPVAQDAAADYLEAQLASYGYAVTRTPVGASENVIARLDGTRLPSAVFLVGAHFDSVPGSPGADDNASGTAALLEMARVLAGRPRLLSIQFAAFGLEEQGLVGSTAHAQAALAGPDTIIAAYSLEMIGYTCPSCQAPFIDVPGCIDVSTPLLTAGNFIGLVANDASFGLVTDFVAAAARYVPSLPVEWLSVAGTGSCFPDTRRSDHAPFWDRGMRGLMLTDTANFRNPNYHTSGDAPATLDYPFATQVTRAVLATVARSTATTQDAGIRAKKLVVVDKVGVTGSAKLVYAAKREPGIAHGPRSDPRLVSGRFDVLYGDGPSSVHGTFTLPAPWLVATDAVAKYVNQVAPGGAGAVKVGLVKPASRVKIVAKGLGDGGHDLDLFAGAPTAAGGVVTALSVVNGADGGVRRMCTRFAADAGSILAYGEIAGGRGRRLVARNGVATACP